MMSAASEFRRAPLDSDDAVSPRVGFFGLLGAGNIGNDASLEAALGYLARSHPDLDLDLMGVDPEALELRYGYPASALNWRSPKRADRPSAHGAWRRARFGLELGVDTLRTARWVWKHDLVVVPGMGVLEASLPLRPWETPYRLFVLSLLGKLLGTPVWFVAVGAGGVDHEWVRRLLVGAAHLAAHRSYRDRRSRDSMGGMGVNVLHDEVVVDLAFALPVPVHPHLPTGRIGVGVMDFRGTKHDPIRADDVNRRYIGVMVDVVSSLVQAGSAVDLLVGDRADDLAATEIVAGVEARIGSQPVALARPRIDTFGELMERMSSVDVVLATRFHNVVSAVKLGKPTVSLGYADKNADLLQRLGLESYAFGVEAADAATILDALDSARAVRAQLSEMIAMRLESIESEVPSLLSVLDRLADSARATTRRRFGRAKPRRGRTSTLGELRPGITSGVSRK